MSPSIDSVYSSVFMYDPYVLSRPYQHLTSMALIELHHIMCISLDISILIVIFRDWACTCRVDTSMGHQKRTHCPLTKDSWLFDELSDNNASDDGLTLAVITAVNEQILELCQCCHII